MKSHFSVLLIGCVIVFSSNGNAWEAWEIENEIKDLPLGEGRNPCCEHIGTNPTLTSIRNGFTLIMSVTELELNCVKSNKFQVNDIFWEIEICKSDEDDSENRSDLDIFLIPSFDKKSTLWRWSYKADALLKILPIQGGESIEMDMKNKNVNYKYPRRFKFNNTIDWNKFLDKYVDHGEVIIEIKLSTSPITRTYQTEQFSSKFRFILENINTFERNFSQEVNIRGIGWKILTERDNDNIAVYLYANECDMDMSLSWDVSAAIKLLSLNDTIDPVAKKFNTTFHRRMSNWGYPRFISWTDLVDLDNQYVEMNAAIFDVEIIVKEPEPLWETV